MSSLMKLLKPKINDILTKLLGTKVKIKIHSETRLSFLKFLSKANSVKSNIQSMQNLFIYQVVFFIL